MWPITFAVLAEMLKVTKVGGHVVIQASEDEGKSTGYEGLHQWNCRMRNSRFLIAGRSGPEVDIGRQFVEVARIVELTNVTVNPAGLTWEQSHGRPRTGSRMTSASSRPKRPPSRPFVRAVLQKLATEHYVSARQT